MLSSYTTVDVVKEALRIPAAITTHDLLITSIVSSIDRDCDRYVGVAAGGIPLQTWSETKTIDWATDMICLDHRPILGPVALTNGGSAVAASDMVVDAYAGSIQLKSGEFSTAPGGVQATYPAGVSGDDEDALGRAATAWAVSRFNRSPHLGMKSESLSGSYRYELAGDFADPYGDMPSETRGFLDSLRSQIT